MPTLSEQLDTSLGGINISVTVDGEVQKLITIGQTLAKLIDNPPNELGDYLGLLSELDLPDFGVTTDLNASFDTIQGLIPADISDLNGGIIASLENLETTALSGVTEVIQPAIDAITAFMTLFKGDITCGLIPGFIGAPPAASDGPPPEPPPPPPPPAEGEPNPGPQNPVVSQDQIDAAKATVNLLPTPLTIENLLPWLSGFWGNHDIPYNILRAVPIIDDLRGPLATMTGWQAMSGADIINQFALTLNQTVAVIEQNTTGYIDLVAADLNDLLAPLNTVTLATAVDNLISHFATIDLAIESGDLSTIGPDLTAINTAISDLQAQHVIWQASVKLPLNIRLSPYGQFPEILEDHIVQLISLLQPRPAFRDIFNAEAPATLDDSEADLPAVQQVFDEIKNFLDTVLDALDLAAVFEPIAEPFDQASEVVDDINQQLVGLTLEVKNRLDGLSDAIDGIDLSTLQTDVQQAIEDFSDSLQNDLNSQFDPVKTAFETVMNELVAAVQSFDPSSIQGEIENVINTITGVFDNPQVQGAIEQLNQLTDVADSIGSISFTPLTDTVIAGIDEVKEALDSIDESTLDPPLPQMLGTAMSVLPDDITPLTDPLVDRLGDLIEAGPINLINQIKQVPAQLFDQVRQYDPETLLGDTLAGPFEDLLDAAEEFSPQKFVDEIESEFDALKERLKKNVSPGKALQPIVDLHRQLAQELAKMSPGDLIEPLDQKIQSVMQALGESIDLDAVLDPLSEVVEAINRQVDQVKKGVDLIQHILTKLNDLADAPAQIETWINGIFDKIPDGIDTSALTSPLNDLANAISNAKSLGLQAHIATQFSPLGTLLDELNAGQRLSNLVQTLTGISRGAIEALPDSAEKTQLLDLLDGLDVTDEEISGALQQLSTLTTVRAEVDAELSLKFTGWDNRYHRPGGTLDSFNQPGVDLVQIKTWLREAIDRQIAWPLEAVFGKITVLKNILGNLISIISDVTDEIDSKIATLLAAPQAVINLGETVQELLDNIAGINLDFLQNSINEIFDSVREKFNDLNPAALQATLDEEFSEIIDSIGFDLIIPPDSFNDLEAAFDDLLVDLEGLNPKTLLIDPLQEVFEENIQPVIDALDVTPLLEAVVERLTPLEDELKSEMDRVNTAYQAMLAAAPDTSLSIDIDVDIGF